jgi:hypothetical protein
MLRVTFFILTITFAQASELRWNHMSSARNDLPVPSPVAGIQSGSLVGDFDEDGTNDFILAFADGAPALVLYRGGTNWSTLQIETEQLPIASGGAALDIDQDGDQDIVFGSETGPEIWWWENPDPKFVAGKPWTRRTIKTTGSDINRGQFAVDISGSGWPQLLFWNQGSNALYHAPIPVEVQKQTNWAATRIFSLPIGPVPGTIQNLTALDLNIDGLIDLVVGNYWLKRERGFAFEPTRIGHLPGLSAVGRFRASTYPQIVIAPQTSRGRVFWYECKTKPDESISWAGRQLLGHDIAPAASLAIGDVNQDGHDDILLSERREASQTETEHWPNAWIFFSDGNGNFKAELFSSGQEMFDAKLVDLDGDGDLDILSTPQRGKSARVDVWLNATQIKAPPTVPGS